jgi:hypothetical protein
MSLYRCAVCGSSKVTVESRQEGYNKKKGVIGTVLFGTAGAIAGVNGNVVNYYHCAECGHTLNKPMSNVEKDAIDSYLKNPSIYKNLLNKYKKQYPNIEWYEAEYLRLKSEEEEKEKKKRMATYESRKEANKAEDKKRAEAELNPDNWNIIREKIAFVLMSAVEPLTIGDITDKVDIYFDFRIETYDVYYELGYLIMLDVVTEIKPKPTSKAWYKWDSGVDKDDYLRREKYFREVIEVIIDFRDKKGKTVSEDEIKEQIRQYIYSPKKVDQVLYQTTRLRNKRASARLLKTLNALADKYQH